jgi:hypothetical protein
MLTYTATDDILRHIQDNSFNCGRTCAQMIISALTLAPAAGTDPRTIAVVPTQATLATRETDQPDPPAPADVWLTHPDEMLELLKDSPELLSAGTHDWRLQAYPTGKALVADVLHTLATSGMPAVVSIKQNDHWVVIKAAHRDDAGRLMIELLDPWQEPVMPRQHFYQDECSDGLNGQAYIKYEVTRHALIGLDLRINARPNPPGMHDYAGLCVGILYGNAPTDEALDETMAAVVDVSPKKRAAGRPAAEDLYDELATSARAWRLEPVGRFLDSRPELVASRWVRGIESPDIEYAVMTMLAGPGETGARRQGLMAAFDADGALQQLQFTTSEKTIRSLARFAGQDLWWTTRWLPTLPSPFYPFARVQSQVNQYVRLVNDTSFEYR